LISIKRVWKDFDKENGMIDFDDFSVIMVNIAKDRGVYINSMGN